MHIIQYVMYKIKYSTRKMDLEKVGCGGIYWIDLAQDRDRWWSLANAVMNRWVPKNVGNLLTS